MATKLISISVVSISTTADPLVLTVVEVVVADSETVVVVEEAEMTTAQTNNLVRLLRLVRMRRRKLLNTMRMRLTWLLVHLHMQMVSEAEELVADLDRLDVTNIDWQPQHHAIARCWGKLWQRYDRETEAERLMQ